MELSDMTEDPDPLPTISSLEDLQVNIPSDICQHFASQYSYGGTAQTLDDILHAMKIPPAVSICRVNLIHCSSRENAQVELEQELQQRGLHESFSVVPHSQLHDALCVHSMGASKEKNSMQQKGPRPTAFSKQENSEQPQQQQQQQQQQSILFTNWPKREHCGWPMTHRVVIVDRFCGEAVLRGSHIFVKGVMVADTGIQEKDPVAVYADVGPASSKKRKGGSNFNRGLLLEHYKGRRCVYLGLGIANCKRSEFFRLESGVGIHMSLNADERAGPLLPPLSGILPSKIFFQHLPSMIVVHALAPEPGDVILDMCSAPGGKTSHIASLVRNKATIVACDKSRKKMVSAKAMFEEMGASCITPLALDSTNCVISNADEEGGAAKSVQEVLALASQGTDGLLNVQKFYPESFDRILLDPPCSALGLRPKLQIVQSTLKDLQRIVIYQRKFVKEAVPLLKPGGTLTYSTCTFHADENERMVRYMLDQYPSLELLPVLSTPLASGRRGLEGMGLTDVERRKVLRFDPSTKDTANDTIGFFVSKFHKKVAS